jgi:hypothetical protein
MRPSHFYQLVGVEADPSVHEAADAIEEVEDGEEAAPSDGGEDGARLADGGGDGLDFGGFVGEQFGEGHPAAVVFVAGKVGGRQFASLNAARELLFGKGAEGTAAAFDKVSHGAIVS